jgi:hypothetical protein
MFRNHIPRDFTLLGKILSPGTKVYISKFGHRYEAIFAGDRFIHGQESFTSPNLFSRYVTDRYNTRAQNPSGWEVIYTLNNGIRKTIKSIYDEEMAKIFK